jgi:hypothetical protein
MVDPREQAFIDAVEHAFDAVRTLRNKIGTADDAMDVETAVADFVLAATGVRNRFKDMEH